MPVAIEELESGYIFLLGVGLLLVGTQLVVIVLNSLEKRDFGSVRMGTLITPLCTGYPNLMIGLFGQERFQGDLVIQLNIGNNVANASLVIGLILLLTGPLRVQPGKGKSKKALKANRAQALAIVFLWLGAGLLLALAYDGHVSRIDGLALVSCYLLYQLLSLRNRPRVTRKKRLGAPLATGLLLLLAAAAWLIQVSISWLGVAMDRVGGLLPGMQLGLFLGLLTVLPECFLLLRLAWRQGSLGLSGLVGDCLVSVPLVIGLSALLNPIDTGVISSFRDAAARPYYLLGMCMLALTLLATRKGEVARRMGLVFMLGYGLVWWITT